MSPKTVLAKAQEAIQYAFHDPSLLEAALTHSSHANHRLQSNERLEFLGDAVLALVVCEEVYLRFPDYMEGNLTKIKSAVVSRKACAEMADRLSLSGYLFLGKGMSGRASLPPSLSAAVIESVIGAIYLDGGLEPARKFILQIARPYVIQAADSQHQHNYKSQLQQHAQKVLSAIPIYELLDEKGPDHSKCFEVCVVLGDRQFSSAWGPCKKEAEQKAAYRALKEMHLLREEEKFEGVMVTATGDDRVEEHDESSNDSVGNEEGGAP